MSTNIGGARQTRNATRVQPTDVLARQLKVPRDAKQTQAVKSTSSALPSTAKQVSAQKAEGATSIRPAVLISSRSSSAACDKTYLRKQTVDHRIHDGADNDLDLSRIRRTLCSALAPRFPTGREGTHGEVAVVRSAAVLLTIEGRELLAEVSAGTQAAARRRRKMGLKVERGDARIVSGVIGEVERERRDLELRCGAQERSASSLRSERVSEPLKRSILLRRRMKADFSNQLGTRELRQRVVRNTKEENAPRVGDGFEQLR